MFYMCAISGPQRLFLHKIGGPHGAQLKRSGTAV